MEELEVWKECSIDPTYMVSSMGRVIGRKGLILSPGVNSKGYLHICSRAKGKSKDLVVHRMIAETFIPNPDDLTAINHINMIKTDNRVSNLEWITIKNNILKSRRDFGVNSGSIHPGATIDEITALAVFTCIENGKLSYAEIAKNLNISHFVVAHIGNGRSWHNVRELIGFVQKRRTAGRKPCHA
jgi:hypothetical protein